MNIETKLIILERIYKIYDKFACGLDVVCKKYCHECCTRDVTMTTLEGYKIIDSMNSKDKIYMFKKLRAESDKMRFKPKITTNGLAERFLNGKDVPDEQVNQADEKCPLLNKGECPLYEQRPFGCRCFFSEINCGEKGYAHIDPFVITVNSVFLQYIEHVDTNGFFSNLTDILLYFESNESIKHYKNSCLKPSRSLVPNRPIKMLIIPPEHKTKIEPIQQMLNDIQVLIKKGKKH